jgi:hypothetical protein
VPKLRSRNSRMPAANSTGKASSDSTAVVNHAQTGSGMRMSDMPGSACRSSWSGS